MSQSTDDGVPDTLLASPRDGNWTAWLANLTREQREGLRQVMQFDLASGLFNSDYFHDLVRAEMERSKRYKRILSLAVIRLDSFDKLVLDQGQGAGDSFLKHAATVIKRQIRCVDIAGRVTENEMAVMMPETNGPSAAMVASRICNNIMGPGQMKQSEDSDSPLLSVGVAAFPRDARDWADLVFWARTDLEQHPC